MPLDSLQSSDLQPLYHGLSHVPCVDENEGGGVSLDEFLDPVNVMIEDFLDWNGGKPSGWQDNVEVDLPTPRDIGDGDPLGLHVALSWVTGDQELRHIIERFHSGADADSLDFRRDHRVHQSETEGEMSSPLV